MTPIERSREVSWFYSDVYFSFHWDFYVLFLLFAYFYQEISPLAVLLKHVCFANFSVLMKTHLLRKFFRALALVFRIYNRNQRL